MLLLLLLLLATHHLILVLKVKTDHDPDREIFGSIFYSCRLGQLEEIFGTGFVRRPSASTSRSNKSRLYGAHLRSDGAFMSISTSMYYHRAADEPVRKAINTGVCFRLLPAVVPVKYMWVFY